MSKIAVIADSGASFSHTKELEELKDLYIVKLSISFGIKEIDEEKTKPDEFYKILMNEENTPKTSQPTPGYLMNLLEELEEKGYTDALYVTMSSGISGTYSTAKSVEDMYEGKINYRAFDSLNAVGTQTMFVFNAFKMIEEGKTLDEIYNTLMEYRKQSNSYFMVDSLELLIKNGRLKGAQAFLGKTLKIKPILRIGAHNKGEIHSYEKVRSSKKAAKRLVELMAEDIKGKNAEVFLSSCMYTETRNIIKEEIKTQLPGVIYKEWKVPPVIASHVGAECYTVQYIIKEK